MADPRLTPARSDLAAKHLEGKVQASRFVEGEEFVVAQPLAPLRRHPSSDAEMLTQALKGEHVMIYERTIEGWAWGKLKNDGYVGFLPDQALAKPVGLPTHKVTALSTFAFPGPSIKLPPVETLPLAAMLTVLREDGAFAVTREGWHVPKQHLGPADRGVADFVAVAESFVGTPYLWGGKSSLGIDCSGLVQLSLNMAGTSCPRDSDMQQDGLGTALDPADTKNLTRGDLIFWKGHVAIVRDTATIVHANGHHMATAIEPTRDAIARIKAGGSAVTAIKRLA
jgi:hypothetical protein